MKSRSSFDHFSRWAAHATGRPITFMLAAAIVLVWLISGPVFEFSDTWQLVINTGTTIITFLMVFLIQSTQNRDTVAIQLKLDELIRSTEAAHNAFLDLEELSEEQLVKINKHYCQLASEARERVRRGESDLGTPEVHKQSHQSPAEAKED